MIISSGYNISGPEVENALLSHDAVSECGVIGKPDPDRGQIVKAYVVLKQPVPDNEEMARALQDHVKRTVAPYKYPREITFMDKLPRTQTGKLQRASSCAMSSDPVMPSGAFPKERVYD